MPEIKAAKINNVAKPANQSGDTGIKQVIFEKQPPIDILKKPKNPFFWPQIIEWVSIVLAILILAAGGLLFIYPSFQKFQTAPQDIERNKRKLDDALKGYQNASKIISQYSAALSSSAQELDIVGRAFWTDVSADKTLSILNEKAKLYGATASDIKERSDLAEFFPNMQIFDVRIKGLPSAISSFIQTFETELPVIWPISDVAVSDEFHQLTVGLLKEPIRPDSETAAFNNDLYSFSKFRIIKESDIDY